MENRGRRGRDENIVVEVGEGEGDWRRGRSESDRETERLFNGVELVIGALGWSEGGREVGPMRDARGTRVAGYTIYTRKCLDDAYLPAYPRNRYFPATASC